MPSKCLAVLLSIAALVLPAVGAFPQATVAPFAGVTVYMAPIDPGITWSAGGTVHVRGTKVPGLGFWLTGLDAGKVSLMMVTLNQNFRPDGTYQSWGSWEEYEYNPVTKAYDQLTTVGTFTGEGWPPDASGVSSVHRVLGHRGTSQFRATQTMYHTLDPIFHQSPMWSTVEGEMLIPPSK